MWKTIFASATGTSHHRSAQPCQDYGLARMLQTDHETVLIAACADGAGSASHSELGSRLACENILGLVCGSFAKGLKSQDINGDHFLEWHRIVLGEIEKEAEACGAGVRELACTLLTAVVGERCASFSQIGDGAIIISSRGSYDCVFWPQSGEYVNTTNFLTDRNFADHLECRFQEEDVAEIAMLTDGLQMLALDYASKKPHIPFFAPLFRKLRQAEQTDELEPSLREFLGSPRVNERTDDDKTLIVATRLAPNGTEATI